MASFHILSGTGERLARPEIRRIGSGEIGSILAAGFSDFWEKPSHYVFLCLIYPVAGIVLVAWTSGADLLPLIYPMVSGFALLGPVAAIGLYEISRRREKGLDTSWRHAFDVRRSPALPSIAWLGTYLLGMFVAWLLVAQWLYFQLFGEIQPVGVAEFLRSILYTSEGLQLAVYGTLIGFCFAVIVLATTVVAFPLLLDRDVGAVAAVETSLRVTASSPVAIALWGLIVAALLTVGMLTLFAGLAIVLPVLGHATWHLYRRTVIKQ